MLSDTLERVSDPQSGLIEPARVAETLHIDLADLAGITQLHRNTLTRSPESPRVQARLGEVMRVLADAADLLDGSTGRAVLWFLHQPLAGFAGRTAMELMRDGHGEAVLKHLHMLRDGAYA